MANKLGTFCKNCTFYDQSNKSCFLRYIEQFESQGANIQWMDDGPIIDRVCPARRGLNWNQDLSLKEKESKLQDELYIYGTIIVLVKSLKTLKKTIGRLKDIHNINRFKIIICHDNDTKTSDVLEECKSIDFTDYRCVQCVIEDPVQMYDEAFKRAKNGFTFFIRSDRKFDKNMIDKVDYAINRLLQRIIYIQPDDDDVHGSVVMSMVYKWLKGNYQSNIADKIESLASEQNIENPITNWNKINEDYKNKP